MTKWLHWLVYRWYRVNYVQAYPILFTKLRKDKSCQPLASSVLTYRTREVTDQRGQAD